jgi:hypothetical protein
MPLGIYFGGFWSGFLEKTNSLHVDFFLQLLSKVYKDIVFVGDLNSSMVLFENTQVSPSMRTRKKWMHTYLFSGESYIRSDASEYNCVLRGKHTSGNIVNCPLYVCYLTCTPQMFPEKIDLFPKHDVVVIISNNQGRERNTFIERLEAQMNVTYAGHYKNNIGGSLPYYYNSVEFTNYIKQFKFVLAMENSRLDNDTYITEKICHGLFAGTVPVYWGSPNITDYFSEDRILVVDEENIDNTIRAMKEMTNDQWLKMVNAPVYTERGKSFGVDTIVSDIQKCLHI